VKSPPCPVCGRSTRVPDHHFEAANFEEEMKLWNKTESSPDDYKRLIDMPDYKLECGWCFFKWNPFA
jgi:hypothetical protein